ncbi:uncharacterized protein LOC109275917 isoform X1 [Panthera pardus]|uniref:Uncharacterized protein LOC109275917 isoform X1 n=1 Tax=Panthera pardus TaxID=9691 RepID=A0A9W2VWG0_PANPR|nr:uncharacterized protein LOC109275917 isoform X1 [Panthera pardus]
MWPFSGVCWDQVASTVSTKCPSSSGTAFSRVVQEPPGPHSVPGGSPFPPEHCQFKSYIYISGRPLYVKQWRNKETDINIVLLKEWNLAICNDMDGDLVKCLSSRHGSKLFLSLPWHFLIILKLVLNLHQKFVDSMIFQK